MYVLDRVSSTLLGTVDSSYSEGTPVDVELILLVPYLTLRYSTLELPSTNSTPEPLQRLEANRA